MFFKRKKEGNKMQITVDKATISLDGDKVTIDLDSKLLRELFSFNMVELSTLEIGAEFSIGDETFILLEKSVDGGTSRVIRKDFLPGEMKFGETSNWKNSCIRTELNSGKYYKKIVNLVGADNLIEMERDLTSLDGLDDYGVCVDKISLLTAAEYAKYHKILGLKSKYSNWWWTITAASTPSNDYSRYVCCVSSSGVLNWDVCDCSCAVRPFLTLKSSILVSCKKD